MYRSKKLFFTVFPRNLLLSNEKKYKYYPVRKLINSFLCELFRSFHYLEFSHRFFNYSVIKDQISIELFILSVSNLYISFKKPPPKPNYLSKSGNTNDVMPFSQGIGFSKSILRILITNNLLYLMVN